jgi:hypothetical protein
MALKWLFFVVAATTPLLLWAVLATVARRRPALLPALYPWLTGLSWATWGLMMVFFLVDLAKPTAPMTRGLYLLPLVTGLNVVRGWVGKRVDPTAFPTPSPDGWWPAPKD